MEYTTVITLLIGVIVLSLLIYGLIILESYSHSGFKLFNFGKFIVKATDTAGNEEESTVRAINEIHAVEKVAKKTPNLDKIIFKADKVQQ